MHPIIKLQENALTTQRLQCETLECITYKHSQDPRGIPTAASYSRSKRPRALRQASEQLDSAPFCSMMLCCLPSLVYKCNMPNQRPCYQLGSSLFDHCLS